MMWLCCVLFFFFFNDPATTEIYTLSLHDALPIYCRDAPEPRKGAREPEHESAHALHVGPEAVGHLAVLRDRARHQPGTSPREHEPQAEPHHDAKDDQEEPVARVGKPRERDRPLE